MNPISNNSYTITLTNGQYTTSSTPSWTHRPINPTVVEDEERYTLTKTEFGEIFGKLVFLIPPLDADLDHPSVREAYENWKQAFHALKVAHEHFETIVTLAKDHA